MYPRWILRSRDIADRKGAVSLVPYVCRCGPADRQCCLLPTHLGADRAEYVFHW